MNNLFHKFWLRDFDVSFPNSPCFPGDLLEMAYGYYYIIMFRFSLIDFYIGILLICQG